MDELIPFAHRILPPRLWIIVMNSSSIHYLVSTSMAGWPRILQYVRSGNWVRLWLPHTIRDFTQLFGHSLLQAIWLTARLQSKRVRQEKLLRGSDGALLAIIRQFVLAGLATTSTLQVFLAWVLRDLPCYSNTLRLEVNRSRRSMPGFLEAPPIKMAKSRSRKASSQLVWMVIFLTYLKQQSSTSNWRILSSSSLSSSSSSLRLNSQLGPNTSPLPSELKKEQAMLPAAPDTQTLST